jgi:hypothetical protein
MAGSRLAGDEDSRRARAEEVKRPIYSATFERGSGFSLACEAARDSRESFRLATLVQRIKTGRIRSAT